MHGKRHRLLFILIALLLTLTTAIPVAGAPLADPPKPPVPPDGPNGSGKPITPPASVRAKSGQKVNIVIEMATPPLASLYAAEKAKGVQQVNPTLQSQYVQGLLQAQAPVVAEAAKHGKVYTQLTNLTNGVGVMNVDQAAIPTLSKLPGVKAVHIMGTFKLDLGKSVVFIGGEQVLEQDGLDGRGTTIAIIDTGLDYTHRDFGGPGTVPAYELAASNPAQLPPQYNGITLFPTQKVITGYDFVGDTWTGTATPPVGVPPDLTLSPDPNPIDLDGHGTHVAGIAAGFGVPNSSVNGSIPTTFIHPTDVYTVFHGVAPAAQLISYKVCSSLINTCDGLAMVAAFDRAADPFHEGNMNHHVDAINMSIGDLFGSDPMTGQAANRAVEAGIAVAVSAGNSGNVPFITGAPSTAERVLGVAASTAGPEPLYGLQVTAPLTATNLVIPYIWQPWSGPISPTVSGPLIEARTVVPSSDPTAQLGCPVGPAGNNPFPPGSLTGKIAVIDRGTCAVSDKGYNAEQAGAIAAIIVSQANNPPAPLSLGENAPTIPEVMIAYANGQKLYTMLRAGTPVTVSIGLNQIGDLADVLAGFTSRGPSAAFGLKPDISAPGSNIFSAAAGTGTEGVSESGTSMASPHIAGSLALMKQAHPDWTPQELEAVLVNTSKQNLYLTDLVTTTFSIAPITMAGAGRVDLVSAAAADSLLLGDQLAHVNFGIQPVAYTYTATKPITIENKSGTSKTYALSASFQYTQPMPSGVSITVSPSSITVPAHGVGTAHVTMVLTPQALALWTLRNGPGLATGAGLNAVEVAGYIYAVDQSNNKTYHAPFYVLPRAASDITANTSNLIYSNYSPFNPSSFQLTNHAAYTGTAEIFQLVNKDPMDVPFGIVTATQRADIQYVGVRMVQSQDIGGAYNSIEFAIKTYAARALPLQTEFDVNIDLDGDGNPDYIVFNYDLGALLGSCCNGVNAIAILEVASSSLSIVDLTDTNIQSSGLILRVPAALIGLASPQQFNFWVEAYDNPLSPGYTNLAEEYGPGPMADRAPDTGSVSFRPELPRYKPSTYSVTLGSGQSTTINVYANDVQDSELGLLIYYQDNVPSGRDADIVTMTKQGTFGFNQILPVTTKGAASGW